ncbi:MAG: 30S ribosomal protein S3 [Candidatus Aureabacteria bacterium]|nr:30S ribosomal protein S3 [Candidatus Auribacterota bacterium]
MGQKVNPIGLRLGINQEWRSKWYGTKRDFGTMLNEDIKLRAHIKERLNFAGVARILIERYGKKIRVTIWSARPGIVIGRKGSEVDKLRDDLMVMTGREVVLDVSEIKRPELEAQLVAENVAQQLVKRVSFRRAMKRALQLTRDAGAEGVKIRASGRLGGAEIARSEEYRDGKVPLHTLRANIDYGFTEARTSYGQIGVKVWIYKGEKLTMGEVSEHGTPTQKN